MNLYETRRYAQRVIDALHGYGWHTEGFALGNDLQRIGRQPLPKDWLIVFDSAERLADRLEANGLAAPIHPMR
jgi:hypothetical protein